MNSVTDSSSLEFDELQRILAGYLEAAEDGRAVAVEELCTEHPTFAEDIREFVESEQELIHLAGPTIGEHARLLASGETSRIMAVGADTKTFPLPTRENKRSRREIPEHFGRYRIQRELGAGAMGTVFLAFDEKLERQVALKIPHDQFDGDSELAWRFDREAKAAAGLHHRNVCPVHDVGEFEGL
ncbi:MAG: hypothetical protein JJ992_23810, partial [Planctomycetes bacterium]|nr:hypothetical protein [Planctomycetota bacterium]